MPAMREPTPDQLLSRWLPLHFFYAQQERQLPAVDFLDADKIPDPQNSLLVHDSDMTSTLTRFHGSRLNLKVLCSEHSDDYLMRMVVLERIDNKQPVEFGAIGIHLEKLESPLRDSVLSQKDPFGGLLEEHQVDYRSRPKGFFRLSADELIADALQQILPADLYGRCNELTDPEGFVFADIVEVLPSDLELGPGFTSDKEHA